MPCQLISKIMKNICSKCSLGKVQKKMISDILSKQKELIFDEARKGYRLGHRQQRCSEHQDVDTENVDQIDDWKDFIDNWRNEMVQSFNRVDESLGDQWNLEDLIRDCLGPLREGA
jgi:hypothetical protein